MSLKITGYAHHQVNAGLYANCEEMLNNYNKNKERAKNTQEMHPETQTEAPSVYSSVNTNSQSYNQYNSFSAQTIADLISRFVCSQTENKRIIQALTHPAVATLAALCSICRTPELSANEKGEIFDKLKTLNPKLFLNSNYYSVLYAFEKIRDRFTFVYQKNSCFISDAMLGKDIHDAIQEVKNNNQVSKDPILSLGLGYDELCQVIVSVGTVTNAMVDFVIDELKASLACSYLVSTSASFENLSRTNPNLDLAIQEMEEKLAELKEIKRSTENTDNSGLGCFDKFIKNCVNDNRPREDLGIDCIDKDLLKGQKLKHGALVIIGAAPGVGKTAFLVKSLVSHMKKLQKEYKKANAIEDPEAKAQRLTELKAKKIAFFSTEMTQEEIMNRMVQNYSNCFSDFNDLNEEDSSKISSFFAECKTILEHNIQLYGDEYNSIEAISRECRNLSEFSTLSTVYIDYVQNIRTSRNFGQEFDRVKHVSVQLANLKKELQVTVICASSANEKDDIKNYHQTPALSHLRGSQQIAFDADLVIMARKANEEDPHLQDLGKVDTKDLRYIDIIKNRDGSPGGRGVLQFTPGFNLRTVKVGDKKKESKR